MPKSDHNEPRPFILVLAGVNGGGKSSLGGAMLRSVGLEWFNPDTYARELLAQYPISVDEASSIAWHASYTRLEAALATRNNYAFETTLGANTIRDTLIRASNSHDVILFFCGLESAELHIRRVQMRVANGGHPISEAKIRERWITARANLVTLLPHLTQLQVFDNSQEVASGESIPFPRILLKTVNGKIRFPELQNIDALNATPEWAKPIIQKAIELQPHL